MATMAMAAVQQQQQQQQMVPGGFVADFDVELDNLIRCGGGADAGQQVKQGGPAQMPAGAEPSWMLQLDNLMEDPVQPTTDTDASLNSDGGQGLDEPDHQAQYTHAHTNTNTAGIKSEADEGHGHALAHGHDAVVKGARGSAGTSRRPSQASSRKVQKTIAFAGKCTHPTDKGLDIPSLSVLSNGELPKGHRPARGRGRQIQLAAMTPAQRAAEKHARLEKNRMAAKDFRIRRRNRIIELEEKVGQCEQRIESKDVTINHMQQTIDLLRSQLSQTPPGSPPPLPTPASFP